MRPDACFPAGSGAGRWLVAVLRDGPGPVLLIRADVDGLSVVEATGLPFASKVCRRGGARKLAAQQAFQTVRRSSGDVSKLPSLRSAIVGDGCGGDERTDAEAMVTAERGVLEKKWRGGGQRSSSR